MFKFILGIIATLGIAFSVALTHAQNTESIGDERAGTFHASTMPVAQVVTAVASRRIVIKGMVLSADTAGVYHFTDGSGGTTLKDIYLPANTNVMVDDKFLSDVVGTTAGNGLYCWGPTSGVLRAQIRFRCQR